MLDYQVLQNLLMERVSESHSLASPTNWEDLDKSRIIFFPPTPECFLSPDGRKVTHVKINLSNTKNARLLQHLEWNALRELGASGERFEKLQAHLPKIPADYLALKFEDDATISYFGCETFSDALDGCIQEIRIIDRPLSPTKPYIIRPNSFYGREKSNGPDGI